MKLLCHEHAKFRLANLTKLNPNAMKHKLKKVETIIKSEDDTKKKELFESCKSILICE